MRQYNLNVGELTAIEGINYCRGKLLERSSYFDRDKLIRWLMIELPILENTQSIKEKHPGKVTFTKIN